MSVLCRATGLAYSVGSKQVLSEIDLDLSTNETVMLIGPNGAGKSTLLKALSGEIQTTEGSISYMGSNVRTIGARRLAQLRAVMSQAAELAFPFHVEEVISIGLEGVNDTMGHVERMSVIDDVARQADIQHLFGRLYQTLSGGEKQRVQFARTIAQLRGSEATTPEQLLFLDEPVSSLDVAHQWKLMETVRDLASEQVGTLVIAHDINLASVYADRVVLLENGKIVADGAPRIVLIPELIEQVFGVRRRPEPLEERGIALLPHRYMAS